MTSIIFSIAVFIISQLSTSAEISNTASQSAFSNFKNQPVISTKTNAIQ
jgi:hypothetical protein